MCTPPEPGLEPHAEAQEQAPERLAAGEDAGYWEPEVIAELRRVAEVQLRGRRGHTLQPTALVHEAWLRLARSSGAWKDRKHFYTVAARAMRQILVDHARGKGRVKRDAGRPRITLDQCLVATPTDAPDVLDLHLALDQLGELDELQGRIVELRFFGGLGVEEVADLLEMSKSTVEREWRAARAWLGVRLEASKTAR